jgi:hypothetical protein
MPPSEGPVARQFSTALRLSVRSQARNRTAWLLLAFFLPAWNLLMVAIVSHKPLAFKLFSTGAILHADGRELSLISAGLNSLTLIVGFSVFAATRRALPVDRRLVFAGYRQDLLLAAKTGALVAVAGCAALYDGVVLLVFWRPDPAGWLAILAAFVIMAIEYGAFGLLLGVLVKGDLEGFFVIIMGSLTDTFLQNPIGNPVANRPVLEYFPSFGPMQFASGVAFGDTTLWAYLALGLAWASVVAVSGLLIFRRRTRIHRQSALHGERHAAWI